MLPETSKSRAARIPLDYHRSVDTLARIKWRLSLSITALTIAWLSGIGWDIGGGSTRGERSLELATHGPLAKPHALWEASCDTCHVPFKPIDGSAWTSRFVNDARASDAKCQACHSSSGHQASQLPGDVASCASCHLDHRGRSTSLVEMPDSSCTRCHASNDQHMIPEISPSFATSVTRFDADRSHHPEFALFRSGPAKDSGRLKFNHALHMSPGFTMEPGGRPIKTLADLPAGTRDDYRNSGAGDGDPVQLRCDSCHQLEGERRGTSRNYMRPIRFEKDCVACHSQVYDPELPAIRHGLQTPEVTEALWQSYAGQQMRSRSDSPSSWSTDRPVPGRDDRPRVREEIGEKVARAERILFSEKKCGECHFFETADQQMVTPLVSVNFPKDLRVVPSAIPQVWFQNAKFNHSTHRIASCRDCHASAYPDDPAASRTSAMVMIPKIDVCVSCHTPRASRSMGAGNNCTDCHRYHNGNVHPNVTSPSALATESRRNPAGILPTQVPLTYTGQGGPAVEIIRWLTEERSLANSSTRPATSDSHSMKSKN